MFYAIVISLYTTARGLSTPLSFFEIIAAILTKVHICDKIKMFIIELKKNNCSVCYDNSKTDS